MGSPERGSINTANRCLRLDDQDTVNSPTLDACSIAALCSAPQSSFGAIPSLALHSHTLRAAGVICSGEYKAESRPTNDAHCSIGNATVDERRGLPLNQISIRIYRGIITHKFLKKGIASTCPRINDTAGFIVWRQFIAGSIRDFNLPPVIIFRGRNNHDLVFPTQSPCRAFADIQKLDFSLQSFGSRVGGGIGGKWRYPRAIRRNGLLPHFHPLATSDSGVNTCRENGSPGPPGYPPLDADLIFGLDSALSLLAFGKANLTYGSSQSFQFSWS
jgi:hypothetical protein